VDLAIELQKIYDSEINLRIGWLWDGGIEIRLGDEVNGFLTQETLPSAVEILPWLQEAIAHFYPDSPYTAALEPELVRRAAHRIFQRPREAAQEICPYCRSPHVAPPGMEQLFQFICSRCGRSVEVKPPRV
jgi:hypothetical protein